MSSAWTAAAGGAATVDVRSILLPALIVVALLLAWLGLLTVIVTRWRSRHGEPVFRRLRNGRLRFEWGVQRAYQVARAHGIAGAETGPITVEVDAGRDRAIHFWAQKQDHI